MSESCKSERAKKPLVTLENPSKLDLAAVRAKLSAARGKHYWRSLDELAESPAFQEMLHREFPRFASEWTDDVSRRNFLKLMGASLALAGLSACTKQPPESIVPYVKQPEEVIPGRPLYFATALNLAGGALPVLVKSVEGRPIKVEGNPEHPAGGKGTDIYAQAAVLGLYDPDRSQTVTFLGETRTWSDLLKALEGPLATQKALKGAGLRFLSGTVTSPTLAAQIKVILQALPEARWHQYEPVNRDHARGGAQMAFGQPADVQYHLNEADVILSLDADFLSSDNNPGFVRMVGDFVKRRKAENGAKMNRLYVVESTPSLAGARADHRLPVKPSEVEGIARALAPQPGVSGAGTAAASHAEWVAGVAKDLQAHRGSCVVMAGEGQPPVVHALAHAMNAALGNVGKTVAYTDPVEPMPVMQGDSIRGLARDIAAGKVELLFILGSNPAYDAPVDLGFSHRPDFGMDSILMKVPLKVHLGLYQDETAHLCNWHVHQAHDLESWSDTRTADGTVSLIQPLIDPLYNGKTAHEVLAILTGQTGLSGLDWLQNYWKTQHTGADFNAWWRQSLHDGFIAATALPAKNLAAKSSFPAPSTVPSDGIDIVFRPDPTVYDGRYANNGWLQELPKPLTKLTWDNALMVSMNDAQRNGLTSGDVVVVELNGRKLELPVWVTPGVPDGTATLNLGYGRRGVGHVADNAGYNAYLLRASGISGFASGLTVKKTGENRLFAAVHLHHTMEGRGPIRSAMLEEYQADRRFAHRDFEEPSKEESFYKPWDYSKSEYAWGMSIDLNSCVGCNACVVACQSENNIPVVGKWEVMRGREMHWIRIDSYYESDAQQHYDTQNPRTWFQPVNCMQCENAPCEVVCPVGATIHSSEGLNDMVYNRCVGTRYCSNNCPYKVRRFNFLLYADYETPVFKLLNNPDVTVRSRGVMEKCTYCIQRINRTRIDAEREDRKIADGEVQTACQQSCPADAIVFGNINDPASRVSKLKQEERNYSLLADLNTHPRTTYLAAVFNPNMEMPEMKGVPVRRPGAEKEMEKH